MKIHRFGSLRELGKVRKSVRNKKIASAVMSLVLVMVAGAGVALGSSLAAPGATYTLHFDAPAGWVNVPGDVSCTVTTGSSCMVTIPNVTPTYPNDGQSNSYTFAGWGSYAPGDTVTLTENTTLGLNSTALGTPLVAYFLSFDANGGTGAPSDVSCTTSTGSCTVTVPNGVPTRASDGSIEYVFQGWWEYVNGAIVGLRHAGDTITLTEGKTLYASWKQKLTVSFDVNTDGDVSNMPSSTSCYIDSSSNGCAVRIPANVPKRDGYYFLGWGVSATDKKASYAPGDNINLYGNAANKLYAVWYKNYLGYIYNAEADESLRIDIPSTSASLGTVNFMKIGDRVLQENTDYTVEKSSEDDSRVSSVIILSSFLEQLDAGNYNYYIGGDDKFGFGELWDVAGEVNLVKAYSLNYYGNEGSGVPYRSRCTTVSTSCTVTVSPTVPIRSGYVFMGWADSNDAAGAIYQAGDIVALTGNKDIYAVWQQKTVTEPMATLLIFNYTNGGSDGVAFTLADTENLPTAVQVDNMILTKDTHYLIDSTAGTLTILPSYLDTLPDGRHAVLLSWPDGTTSAAVLTTTGNSVSAGVDPAAREPFVYTVKFDKNTTDEVTNMPGELSDTSFEYAFVFEMPSTVPVRDGYVFKGWGLTNDATTPITSLGMVYTDRTVTVYAIWEVASNDENGGDAEAGDNNASNGPALAVPDTGANAEKTDGVAGITLASVGVAAVVATVFVIIRQKHHAVGFTKK